MLNFIFLIVYVALADLLSGLDLLVLLTLHFTLCIVNHVWKKKPMDPLLAYYVGVIMVNIANIALIDQVETGHITTYTYIIPRYIDLSAQIWCISSTLFIFGFQAVKKRSLPPINVELTNPRTIQRLFWLLMIVNGLTLMGSALLAVRGSSLGKVFGLLNSIGILFFARLWAKEESKTFRTYTIALFVVQTYIALTTSFLRNEIILPTFYLAAGYFIGKNNIKYFFSYRILPFVAIIAIYASVFSSLQENRLNFISVFTENNVRKNPEKKGGFLDRLANLAQLTNIVNLVEKNGTYNGRASEPILIALIPRVLWPEKPLIQIGAWFALEIGVAYKTAEGRANNSINMTAAGQLYLDFGMLGVIIGSLLLGAFFAIMWNATRFFYSEYNLTGTIFGGYLFLLMLGYYADLQIVITLGSTYIMFYIIKKMSGMFR
jgi:hypothetical protein